MNAYHLEAMPGQLPRHGCFPDYSASYGDAELALWNATVIAAEDGIEVGVVNAEGEVVAWVEPNGEEWIWIPDEVEA